MDGNGWIARYAEALGVEAPSAAEVETVLRVAAVAAHASERWAAPVTCWLAAAAGLDPDEALAQAERIADDPVR